MKRDLFSLYTQRLLRYRQIFKIVIFGNETWPLAKVWEVTHILCFHTKGSNLILFSFYGQPFPRQGQIFKVTIFGHETCPLVRVPTRSWTGTFFLSKSYFRPTGHRYQDFFTFTQLSYYIKSLAETNHKFRRSSDVKFVFSEKSQVHQRTPKWPWKFQGQHYPIYFQLVPPSPKFHSVSFYN